MAATRTSASTSASTSTSATATPTVDTNNLTKGFFTDLGPLVALFGDEITKQFLSISLGIGDNVLLAIAPIGIMTTIVSAIRVGGYTWMKGLIGRARDSPDDEEKELLSSTSSSVREIWNGYRVIRQLGESQTIDLVIQDFLANEDDPLQLTPLTKELLNGNWVINHFKGPKERSIFGRSRPEKGENAGDLERRMQDYVNDHDSVFSRKTIITTEIRRPIYLKKKAPNITLNNSVAMPDPISIWCLVAIGAALQGIILFFNAYVVYHKHWLRAGARVASYGFPLWVSGTISITAGLFVCALVIEQATIEYVAKPRELYAKARIIRFQKAIPSMNLPAYAFLERKPQVLMSQRTSSVRQRNATGFSGIDKDKNYMAFATLAGTVFALAGFVLQNLGTRELHFSAAIAQLVATLTLTSLRSWVRRNIGSSPGDCEELKRGVEGAHMICKACNIERFSAFPVCSLISSDPTSASIPWRLRIGDKLKKPLLPTLFTRWPTSTYILNLLKNHTDLEELGLLPEQYQMLFSSAEKAVAFIEDLVGPEPTHIPIFFRGAIQSLSLAATENNIVHEGFTYFYCHMKSRSDFYKALASLWSFCLYEQLKSKTETDFNDYHVGFHIVAVCKRENYNEQLELLKEYIRDGDQRFAVWKVNTKENFLSQLDPVSCFFDSVFDNIPLFGLGYLYRGDSDRFFEEDDIVITYSSFSAFLDHLVVDFISASLFSRSCIDGKQKVAESPSRQASDSEGKRTLQNTYFDSLAGKLRSFVRDRDLALLAIVRAFMHHRNMPSKHQQENNESNMVSGSISVSQADSLISHNKAG